MGRMYRFLGLTVGLHHHRAWSRRSARKQYSADITYGTNNEFGFDYLRDNMAMLQAEQLVQRGHHYAIVDEVDSILIDEARTPLIISGPAEGDVTRWYRQFAKLVLKLTRRRGLRRRREEEGRRHPGPGHHQGRGLPRHRQPV